jgi:hypothetical protein
MVYEQVILQGDYFSSYLKLVMFTYHSLVLTLLYLHIFNTFSSHAYNYSLRTE